MPRSMPHTHIRRFAAVLLAFTTACSDVEDADDGHDGHNHGLTTKMVLNFTPDAGGSALSFVFSDPNNDGNSVVDTIELTDASDYTVDVEVWNELEDPEEDVTAEIEELLEEHQFFFTGSGVESPATGSNPDALVVQDYLDQDADGLPVGLVNSFSAVATGTGEMTVTLRHLPPENDSPTKVAGMAEDVAQGGFSSIAGDNDISVTFPISVQ